MLGLDIAFPNTKIDHSGFSLFRDMVGAHQNLNGLRNLRPPFRDVLLSLGKDLLRSTCYQIWSLHLRPRWRFKMWKM